MMKPIYFFASALVLLFMVPERTKAQEYYSTYYDYKPVSMGITFSPNVGWLRYGDSDDYDGSAGLGFAYGLLADFAFSESYYFSTGLLINSLYADGKTFIEGRPTKMAYRLQYAEVPLAIKLRSAERYHRSYYGKFGFTTGVKVSGRERIDGAANRTTIDGANVFRLALQIGGGVEWTLDHNMRFMTGLTFNNGFTRALRAGDPRNSYVSFDLAFFL